MLPDKETAGHHVTYKTHFLIAASTLRSLTQPRLVISVLAMWPKVSPAMYSFGKTTSGGWQRGIWRDTEDVGRFLTPRTFRISSHCISVRQMGSVST